MKPKKPFLATTQVPNDVLIALSKRRLLNSEIRIVAAVCQLADMKPGECKVQPHTMADAIGEKLPAAADLVRAAVKNGIITLRGNSYKVQAPSTWNVPGRR